MTAEGSLARRHRPDQAARVWAEPDPWSDMFPIAAGGTALVLGIAVMIGWHVGAGALVQVHPSLAPMQYLTALGFALSGAGCLLLGLRRGRLAAAAGAPVALLGLLSVAEYLTGADFGIERLLVDPDITVWTSHPGRMPPNSAVAFALAGIALALAGAGARGQWRALVLGVLASVVIGLGLVALLGYVAGVEAAYGWASLSRMAVHTASGFVVVGMGLFVFAMRNALRARSATSLQVEVPVAAGLAVLSVLLWQALIANERQDVLALIDTEADTLADEMLGRVNEQVAGLFRMARRWERREGIPRADWEADSRNYIADYPGLEAIAWVDPAGVVQWVVPAEGNERAIGRNLRADARPREAADRARARRTPAFSRSVDLDQGGKGFLVFVPLYLNEAFDGFIVGVFDFDRLFAPVGSARLERGYDIAVYDGEEVVLGSASDGAGEARDWRVERELTVGNATWRTELWPTRARLAALPSAMPYVTLVAGLTLTALVTFTIRLAVTSRRQAVDIERANVELDAELERRRRAEADLIELRRRYELILESAGEGIYGVDPDGNTTFVNPAATRLTGWSAAETRGKPQHELIHHSRPDGSPYPKEECPIYATCNDGQDRHVEDDVFWRQDGTSFPVEYVSSPIRDAEGKPAGAVVVFRDVTQRKQAEEALRRRTAELAAANQELEAFAYSVSHDLRAPLRSMDGFSQALFEDFGDRLDGEAKDYLMRIRAASQVMSQLIDDLLKLSRVARAELNRTTADLSALAHAIAARLADSEPTRAAEFDIAPEMTAEGDERLLAVVLENLIGNAWKFTRKRDHARIEFGVERGDAAPIYFVRDDGAGFDMTYADKLFRPFHRLHRTDEFEGTGIGLATVARIVHRHGGRVWADSAVGRGTTVFFTLTPEAEPQ